MTHPAILADTAPTILGSVLIFLGTVISSTIGGFCLIKVAQLKIQINSRMDELLDLTKKAAKAEGVIEGVAKERASVAEVENGIKDRKDIGT